MLDTSTITIEDGFIPSVGLRWSPPSDPSEQSAPVAYLAGFFDGEGTITISRGYLKLAVGQIDPRPLHVLHEVFGGMIYIQQRSKGRPLTIWQISARQAAKFLRTILPYLIVKKDQALLALAFQATLHTGNQPVTHEEREIRTGMAREMSALNHRHPDSI